MLQLLKYGFKKQSTYFQIGQMSGAWRLTEKNIHYVIYIVNQSKAC